ncbi:N-acetylneuraminate synthase family protein, partial [Candidatus Pelagibacter sp.]|nr:N-acetylneuraminate synthase family protein [Candidatus Pelagibacter sp.]
MKIGNIDTNKKVFIIAEIGNNHEGSFDLAKKMIIAAANSGVDAVKFQTFIPELFVSSEDILRLNKLKKFKLSFKEFKELSKVAKKNGLIFFSTPLDLKSAKFLNNIQPIFKISSGDNNFYPLIEKVARFEKPMIVSTGVADVKLIRKVYNKIYKVWSKKIKINENLAFLHCVGSYPVPFEQANLASIAFIKKKFPNVVLGYSDHTVGNEAAVLSVMAGARIVEKHFTIDKKYSDFRDHHLSADPKDMKLIVSRIREIEKMLGNDEKKIQSCEKEMKILGRRSIAVLRDMPAGTKLKISDITWLRPGNG